MVVTEHGGTLIDMLQVLLVIVLLITIGINVMFILDTNRRLHEDITTTGIYEVTNISRVLAQFRPSLTELSHVA
jgi:uncharacterized membrane protein YqjE